MNLKKIQQIKEGRLDLSDFLIHFTRTGEKNSFSTLKSIVTSGQINCGWSIRGYNNKRTIFGHKPAICFTDMPLFSFYDYVVKRNDRSKVDFYGVALRKKTMFRLGARNVIYGTTAANELEREENGAWINPNLTATEQYRYMLTAIDDQNDWTHEREWRWTNQSTVYKSNGDHLPIWQNNVTANFNIEWGDDVFRQDFPIILFTRYEDEVDELQRIVSGFSDPHIYNLRNLAVTYAFSLEKASEKGFFTYDKFTFSSLMKDRICRKLHPREG